MRRKLKKIELDAKHDAMKPMRRVKGVEVRRWCPQFDHRGPWEPVGGLEIPDNATAVGRELLEATKLEERCDWCGAVRVLDGLEIRRRLRPIDYEAAVQAREREIAAKRKSPAISGRQRFLFLLEVSDKYRRHLVGRHRTFCGVGVQEVMWDGWAGSGGGALQTNRCRECHAEVVRITEEQLAVAFAYMLAVGRMLGRPHPNDQVKQYDPETGRALIRGEWLDCVHCDSTGKVRPDEADWVWHECEACAGMGFLLPA